LLRELSNMRENHRNSVSAPFRPLSYQRCIRILSRNLATGPAHDASMICPLILRLYEQSKDNHPEITNRCLDAWDIMFEHRIGIVSDLMKQLDQ